MVGKRKKSAIKSYRVEIGMNVTVDYFVKARTSGEAKRKAMQKFKNRLPARRWFDIDPERID